MPSGLRIVPARARSRIQLIPVQQSSDAHHRDIVLTFHHQFIVFTRMHKIGNIKRKRSKQPFMTARKTAVHIHPCNIIHTLKLQYDPLFTPGLTAGKMRPVISFPFSVLSGRPPVIRQRHFFPDGVRPVSVRKDFPFTQITEQEPSQLHDFRFRLPRRQIIRHKRAVFLPQRRKLPVKFLSAFFKRIVLSKPYFPVRKRRIAFFKQSVVFLHGRDFSLFFRYLNPVVRYILKNIFQPHNPAFLPPG